MYLNSTIFDKQNFYLTVSLSIHPSIPLSIPFLALGRKKENKQTNLHIFLYKLYRYIRYEDFGETKKSASEREEREKREEREEL